MKNLRLLLSAFCLVAAADVCAAKETASSSSSKPARHVSSDDSDMMSRWDTDVTLSYAFSMNSNFTNPSAAQFNVATAATGADADSNPDNAKLGDAVGLGLCINYRCCSWFDVGISGDLYSPFEYAVSHTGGTLATARGTAGGGEVLGGVYSTGTVAAPYARSFTLNNQSFMFNVYLHLPERLAFGVGHMNITPLIGGGVGVGLNKVSNFASTGWSNTTPASGVLQLTTLAAPHLKASVAGQAVAGLDFAPEGSDMSFGVAYRFYYGGKFSTGTSYQLNDTLNGGAVVTTLDAWTGRLMTNQVAMFLNFEF